jgi:hypothetical protein
MLYQDGGGAILGHLESEVGDRDEHIHGHAMVLGASFLKYLSNGKPSLSRLSCRRSHISFLVLTDGSAFDQVLNVILIEQDFGSMPVGPGELGTTVTPLESSIWSSDGTLVKMTRIRRSLYISGQLQALLVHALHTP